MAEMAIERYAVYKGSKSAHCCFEATVVDTTKPKIIGGEHYRGSDGQLHYETVCECFCESDAEMVCRALNLSAIDTAISQSEGAKP